VVQNNYAAQLQLLITAIRCIYVIRGMEGLWGISLVRSSLS